MSSTLISHRGIGSAECKMTLAVVSSYSYLCLHPTSTVTRSRESLLSSGVPLTRGGTAGTAFPNSHPPAWREQPQAGCPVGTPALPTFAVPLRTHLTCKSQHGRQEREQAGTRSLPAVCSHIRPLPALPSWRAGRASLEAPLRGPRLYPSFPKLGGGVTTLTSSLFLHECSACPGQALWPRRPVL